MKWKKNKSGFTIIEALVSIAVIVAVFTAVLGFSVLKNRIDYRNQTKIKAIFLAEEALEAVHNFRDNTEWLTNGVDILIPDIAYYPVKNSFSWDIVAGAENINGFTRTIIFSRVSRDINKNIEPNYNPANDDSNTKKLLVTISWNDRYGLASESLTTYITNWRQ